MNKAIKSLIIQTVTFLTLFSIVLVFILSHTSFSLSKSGADFSIEKITEILQPLPESLDNTYWNFLANPIDEFFQSVGVVSFSFTSPAWPADETCVARVRDDLYQLVNTSPYISGAFIYNSSTDAYASSLPRYNAIADQKQDPYFRDIIFSYNSGAVDKQQLESSGNLSFIFSHNNELFITKELTTRTGSPLSTLFVTLDIQKFSEDLCAMFRLGEPYSVNVYSDQFQLLFSNSDNAPEIPRERLMDLSNQSKNYTSYEDNFMIYYTSSVLPWQVVFVVDQDYLNVHPEIKAKHWLAAAAEIAVLVAAFCGYLFYRFYNPIKKIVKSIDSVESRGNTKTPLIDTVQDRLDAISNENAYLRDVVNHYSGDVLRSMFLGLIMGQQYTPDDLKKTLNYTGSSFTPNDVYIVGVIKNNSGSTITSEMRFKMLTVINETLKQFQAKHKSNTFAFSTDFTKIVIIVAFPHDKTIAEGKTMTTDLASRLREQLRTMTTDFTLHFGHLYHSLLDVGFSYSEADRATAKSPGVVSPVVQDSAAKSSPSEEYSLLIRRSEQIVQLVNDGKAEEADQLIYRAISDIFSGGSHENHTNAVKYILSAVIEQIVSRDFVSHNQLTDVTKDIYELIDKKAADRILQEATIKAIRTLCNEYFEILQKQRHPYITAALDYIEKNYSDPNLSLDQIAEHLRVAPNYLSTLFSKNLGVKLFDYISDYRIQRSVEFLNNSNLTINEISELSGFGSVRNFIRVFKKMMNTTPGNYRKQAAGGKQ